jgi:hypothetical protein
MYDINYDPTDLTTWLNYTLVNGPYANQKLALPASTNNSTLFVTIGESTGRYVSNYNAYTGKLIQCSLIWEPKTK